MCLSAIFLCGTLVVTVPTDAGLVAAADCRMTNSEKTRHCDDEYKIVEFTSTTQPAVGMVTGMRAVVRKDLNPDW